MEKNEIEAKVFLSRAKIARLKEKILKAGGKRNGISEEKNFILDHPGGTLKKKGDLLRVRIFRNGKGLVTFKKTIKGGRKSRFKAKKEKEVEVGDGEGVLRTFESMGLVKKWRYDKRRESFRLGKINIEIDTLPVLGTFVEVEARSEKELEKALKELGLDKEEISKETYHEVLHRRLGLGKKAVRDLVWGK
jgi:predicted adenylyl cyclase CyaB